MVVFYIHLFLASTWLFCLYGYRDGVLPFVRATHHRSIELRDNNMLRALPSPLQEVENFEPLWLPAKIIYQISDSVSVAAK